MDDQPGFAVLPVRSSRSCTECTRRKIKCDRAQPCAPCSKGGRAHACNAPPRKRQAADPAVMLDERRTAALSELRLFRDSLASLQARIPNLEHFIANSGPGEGDEGGDMSYLSSFGNPLTKLAPRKEEDDSAPSSSKARRTVEESESAEPDRKRIKQGSPSTEPEETDSAAVETTVDLEFMTLGRPRNVTDQNHLASGTAGSVTSESSAVFGSYATSILAPPTALPSPVSIYPDAASLFSIAPTLAEEEVVFGQGFDFGWHHSVVHAGTFSAQLAAFRELGEERFERCSPAWLSLYFALLAVSTKLVDSTQQEHLGWTEEQAAINASTWFQASISCLYRHNYLQNYDFFTLQAIALLVLSGRDAGSAALIASLLSSALSVAQDLLLHRQCSDAEWEASMKGKPVEVRARSLTEREVRKRVLWALAHSDWFAIPFRSAWILGRTRISTPLPLNCTDEDLLTGEIVNRPVKEYTVVSWLRQYIELGGCMQVAFEHSTSKKAEADYGAFLKIDTQLEALLADLPPWLRPNGDTKGMPPACVEIMRSTFLVSAQHKILSIHRPFLARRNKAAYAFSRRRVVMAARAILREGARVRDNRVWTVLYHLSVALFSITLELFEQLKHPSAEADAMRAEVWDALPTLEGLRKSSSIADRGLVLVLPLLEEEKRLKEEADQRKSSRKTKSTTTSDVPAPLADGYNPTEPLHFPPPHMFYPPPLASTNSTAASSEAGASSTGQPPRPGPSPETFPSWMFGEGWLDSQLSSAPFGVEEGTAGQMRTLPPMMGYPPGAGGIGMMMPPWQMMPPHHPFGGPHGGPGGPWEGWQG
ncbi:hypothetical protein BCR35DRAFT_302554 [Leucosporidium creatinivorum]|uniref:Zn(2)-C6 fungal-type domain-containing protein n=1 Tax=Leucosporidium creatinivorum TaxID=106004 RepID=A0A1Y2FRN4_9BASI|nr:hypothetical protein BCR35DRAFT_302554 [Leucosporidium creatinivorum]